MTLKEWSDLIYDLDGKDNVGYDIIGLDQKRQWGLTEDFIRLHGNKKVVEISGDITWDVSFSPRLIVKLQNI